MRSLQNSYDYFNKNRESGLAALEFIICLPVLLMLLVLLIDASRAFIQYTEINKALQNGVRYAVVDTYGTLDFGSIAQKEYIQNMVVYGKAVKEVPVGTEALLKYIEPSEVNVSLSTEEPKEVTLSVNYTYVPIFSRLPFTNRSLSFNIGASSKMRTSP